MKRPPLRCPRCQQAVEAVAAECASCGLSLGVMDSQFGEDCVVIDRVTDAAHVLRVSEKDVVTEALDQFERRFPQLFFAVYVGALPSLASLRLFGFWLLNRAALTSVDFTRPNENGVLLVVDVKSKTAGLTLGYALESLFDEKELSAVLRPGRAHFVNGQTGSALARVVAEFSAILNRKLRRAARNPARFSSPALVAATSIEDLPRLRDGHRPAGEASMRQKDPADE